MKSTNRYFIIVFIAFLVPFILPAQIIDTAKLKAFQAPHERVLFHEQVVAEQKNMLKNDGKADLKLEISDNPDINFMVTRTVRWEIRDILYQIEKDSTLNPNCFVVAYYVQNLLRYITRNHSKLHQTL